jgi:hypothetical protein
MWSFAERRRSRHTGIKFEEAANELVRDLTPQDLKTIIFESESRYGKEVVCNEQVV